MTDSPEPEFVVITSVFEDKDASSHLFKDLADLDIELFIIAIDDGSVHEPLVPEMIDRAGLKGVVVRLNRNVGHQRAIAVGLHYVAANHPNATAIIMDCDGEDSPASIPQLLVRLNSGVDIVVAERKSRVAPIQFKIFYVFYKCIYILLSGKSISFGNFMVLTPNAVKRLVSMDEPSIHLASSVLASKLRVTLDPIDRGRRYAGRSKMNLISLALHGFRGLMVFAEDILIRVGFACAVIAFVSFVAMPIPLALKAINMATPGWSSVIFGLLILLFIQTGTITLLTLLMVGLVKSNVKKHVFTEYIDKVIPTSEIYPMTIVPRLWQDMRFRNFRL